jgi:DNA-binding CsgD family transcriptional regulator
MMPNTPAHANPRREPQRKPLRSIRMTPDDSIAAPPAAPARPGGLTGLTDEQRRLARLVAAGAAPAEIAARLDRSPRRVARDLRALPAALGLASLDEVALAWWGTRAGARADLAAAAARLGVAA